MVRVLDRGKGIELRLRPRRVRIKPEEKRHEYINRLDAVIEKLEEIINSEETPEKIRIQAANALARIVSTSYVMIVDIDVENLEEEAERLRKLLEERREEDLGYVMKAEDGSTLVWDKDKKEWVPKKEKPKK